MCVCVCVCVRVRVCVCVCVHVCVYCTRDSQPFIMSHSAPKYCKLLCYHVFPGLPADQSGGDRGRRGGL